MSSTVIPLEDLEYTVDAKFNVPDNKEYKYKETNGKSPALITSGEIKDWNRQKLLEVER